MNSFLNRAKVALTVLMIAAAPAGVALAAEGNSEPFDLVHAQISTSVQQAQTQVGRTARPSYDTSPVVTFSIGGVAPANGSEGEPEPLNALPSAPEIGGVWPAQPVAVHG